MSDTTSIIKALRAAKLSQSEISRRTGIPQPRLSRWEAGEVPDAADDALKLAALWRMSQGEGAKAPEKAVDQKEA